MRRWQIKLRLNCRAQEEEMSLLSVVEGRHIMIYTGNTRRQTRLFFFCFLFFKLGQKWIWKILLSQLTIDLNCSLIRTSYLGPDNTFESWASAVSSIFETGLEQQLIDSKQDWYENSNLIDNLSVFSNSRIQKLTSNIHASTHVLQLNKSA